MDDVTLIGELRGIVGDAHVRTGDQTASFATDIYRAREMPVAVVSPGTVDELQSIVRLAAAHGIAIVVRGGGASYTDSYLPAQKGMILIDALRLNRIVEINLEDSYVTVEAGVSWAKLAEALDAIDMRTPFRGPFSGSVATVGGTMSQNGLSHGTGMHGVASESVTSLDVILANGELLRTGVAMVGATPFYRHYGPDITGLFLGDCGIHGVKARITMPLLPKQKDFGTASFGFDSFEAFYEGMKAAAREVVDDTQFGLDASMIRGQLKRGRRMKDTLRIAKHVWSTSPGVVGPLRQLARMALAGERSMGASAFLAHYIVEGGDAVEVRQRMGRLRRAVLAHGREITNTIPTVVRAQPFDRMFHVLGPKGERWVPVHGLVAHSRVAAFKRDYDAICAKHAAFMTANGVWLGGLFQCVGLSGFMIEYGIYWPEEMTAYHKVVVTNPTTPAYSSNAALTEWVAALRVELIELFTKHGAVHFQLGKVYPYAGLLEEPALSVAKGIKAALDPERRLNPGGLGL